MTKLQKLTQEYTMLKFAYQCLEDKQDYLKETFDNKFDLSLENYGLKKENERLNEELGLYEKESLDHLHQIESMEETFEKRVQSAYKEGIADAKLDFNAIDSLFYRHSFSLKNSIEYTRGYEQALKDLSSAGPLESVRDSLALS
jgi:hypothetical protein